MATRCGHSLLSLAILVSFSCLMGPCEGFLQAPPGSDHRTIVLPNDPKRSLPITRRRRCRDPLELRVAEGSDTEPEENSIVIVRGTEDDDFPDELWDEIEAGQPSELNVMKEVGAWFVMPVCLLLCSNDSLHVSILF